MNAVNPLTFFALNLIINHKCIQEQIDNTCVSIFTSIITNQLASLQSLSKLWVTFQCLVVICLVLARTGFNEGTRDLGHFVDEKWLNTATLVSYAFILPIFIITHLLGDIVPVKMVSLLKTENRFYLLNSFWLVCHILCIMTIHWFVTFAFTLQEMMFQFLGFVLFVTSGSFVVDKDKSFYGSDRNMGVALGSLTIITGIFFLVDFILLAKDHFKKN